MTKAYWIARVRIKDPAAYAGYQAIAAQAFAAFDAKFLARTDTAETLEGEDWHRHVVIEFPSKSAALECYNSPEYHAARRARAQACSVSITIVDAME